MMEKRALWDQGAEQSVIGGIVADDRTVVDIKALVSPNDFFYGAHQEIYRTALSMHERGEVVDIVTLTGECREHASYIGQIAADVPGAANVLAYAGVVADYSRRRAVVEACRKTIDTADSVRAGELISELSGQIEQAGERAIGESLDWRSVLTSTVEMIEAAANSNSGGIVGVPTGLPMIDQAMSGLCSKRFIVLAARPSIGKTALANQIIVNAVRRGHPMGVCSLEMGEDELGCRALAHRYRVNFTKLMRGRSDALDALVRGMQGDDSRDWPIHMDTATYTLSGIEARITGWKRKHDIRAAVVDHIGLIETEGKQSTYDRMSMISRRLKKLAKRLDIAIIGVCQLNRALEKEKRRPLLSDLRDSGNIEQDIDVGIFLHVEPEDVGEAIVDVEVGFLKNRTGRRGWLPHALKFEGQYQTFTEYAPEYAEVD